MVVRASGTEAKLKYYFDYAETAGAGGKSADRYLELEPEVRADCSAVYADLARRAGYDLSPAALDLPDVLPMQDKAAHDRAGR
jgi:hypothetical protein